jgi:hypothetical protein
MLPKIELEPQYLFLDSGTSDGTQIKYYCDNMWYKIDRYGGEGAVEELASDILSFSGLKEEAYVKYKQVLINDEPGCVSENFLGPEESFITIYRLYSNIEGRDLARVTAEMDYDTAIDYVLEFVERHTQVDLREYLANTFALDALILNEDRHFNNMGLIFDGSKFRTAPIFDNGKSLFVGNTRYRSSDGIAQNRKRAFAKAFSGSYQLNRSYLQAYCTLDFDYEKIRQYLEERKTGEDSVYDRLAALIRSR